MHNDQRHNNGPAPARSLTQRLEALEEANTVRTARAELKRRIKREGVQIAVLALELNTEALGLRDHDLDTMKVYDLLVATPKYGRSKANRLLVSENVSPSKTIAGLSDRQRDALVSRIRPAAPAPPAFDRFERSGAR